MDPRAEHVERYLARCLDCLPPNAGGLHDPLVFTDANDAAAYAERHVETGADRLLGAPHRVIITNAIMVHWSGREET